MKWFDKKVFDRGGQGPKNCYKSHGCVPKFVKICRLLSENLKNLCRKRETSAGCRFTKNPFAWFFKKKSTGVAILETALTLPIVLYIVFFSIELIRMELAQTAVDSITKEFTFYLMAKGKIVQSEVDAIFKKYRPWGIPIGNFRYYIRIYPHMTSPDNGTTKGVMDTSPYGGESIFWVGEDYANPDPNASPTGRGIAAGGFGTGDSTSKNARYSKYVTVTVANNVNLYGEVGYVKRNSLLLESGNTSGYIFVLTVAVVFPFSSPFVKKLFGGGTNTNKEGVYILWARGSGMIN